MFTHALTDLRDAWAAVSFARPEAFALLAVVPLLAVLDVWAARRRRTAVARIGSPLAVDALRTPPVWGLRLTAVAYPLAWVMLVAGLAGPRWGTGDEGGVAVGRDLVVVLDLSRSMLADDMARGPHRRADAAKAAVLGLVDAVGRRGGHRVGVVVFAARPVVVCPLTTDTDHVRAAVDALDPTHPPPGCRPDAGGVSGTRIGAALAAAVGLHDPRFPGSQDVILLSDGDDPVDDREWERGADAARRADIPVYTVGFGDPDEDSKIDVGGHWLEAPRADGGPADAVGTRLREGPLKATAAETRGRYVAARREAADLGEFFRVTIEPRPSREVGDDHLPRPTERYPWPLAAALLLFAIGWVRGR